MAKSAKGQVFLKSPGRTLVASVDNLRDTVGSIKEQVYAKTGEMPRN